jgi:hypothetical protein
MADPDKLASIRADLAKGKTKEEIYLGLLQAGEKLPAIEAYFDRLDDDQDAGTQNRAVRIMLVVGGVFIGLAYLSFVIAGWDSFGAAGQTLVMFSSTALAYFLGWYFRSVKKLRTTGDVLSLLGLFLFGVSWFVLAGAFDRELHWQDGFLIWLVGALVTARAARVFMAYAAAVVFAVGAAFGYVDLIYTEPTTAVDYPYAEYNMWPEPIELPVGLMALAGAAVAGAFGYDLRRRKPIDPETEVSHV